MPHPCHYCNRRKPGGRCTLVGPMLSCVSPQQNVPLAPWTTFGVGGPARWFASVATEEQLAEACAWAGANGLPLFVLGGGSNLLIADGGFPGLVLHIALRGISVRDGSLFRAAAGEDWDALVTRSVLAGCAGMECLAGIPGSVGGTPVQNVGAYGQEVSQTVVSVRCFDRAGSAFVDFSGPECGFGYRTSRFNAGPDRGRYIVTAVEFGLQPGGPPSLRYADLQQHFAGWVGTPSLAEVAEAVRQIRRSKGMVVDTGMPLLARDPDTRSAGSFFKNPIVPEAVFQAIAAQVAPAAVPRYPAREGDCKLPAAWLVERAGFAKGFALGGAAISSKHTLALTNRSGSARAAELVKLRDSVVEGVEARFGVRLEPEPVLVGEL